MIMWTQYFHSVFSEMKTQTENVSVWMGPKSIFRNLSRAYTKRLNSIHTGGGGGGGGGVMEIIFCLFINTGTQINIIIHLPRNVSTTGILQKRTIKQKQTTIVTVQRISVIDLVGVTVVLCV